MKLASRDIKWLEVSFPSLSYKPDDRKIVGELDFRACYDNAASSVRIERLKCNELIRKHENFISDVFEVEFLLDDSFIEANGWPKVYEVGGRCESIAKKYGVSVVDLHVYAEDGACCLGIRYSPERSLTIERFLDNLVIPFFYRLSYTDRRGIEAARNDLWGEYSHGEEGHLEHQREMFRIGQQNPGRNERCPCGSGKKYKKCCLDEVPAASSGKWNRISSIKQNQPPHS